MQLFHCVHLLSKFCCPVIWELLPISFLHPSCEGRDTEGHCDWRKEWEKVSPVQELLRLSSAGLVALPAAALSARSHLIQRILCKCLQLALDWFWIHAAYCGSQHLDFHRTHRQKHLETLSSTSAHLRMSLGQMSTTGRLFAPKAAPSRDFLQCTARSNRHGLKLLAHRGPCPLACLCLVAPRGNRT